MAESVLSDQMRRRHAALMSVHHHSGQIVMPNFLLPAPLRLMPLKDSVTAVDGEDRRSAHRALARALARSEPGPGRRDYLKNAFAKAGTPNKTTTASVKARTAVPLISVVADKRLPLSTKFADIPRPEPPVMPGPCLCCEQTASEMMIPSDDFPVLLHDHAAWVDLDSSVAWIVIRLKLKPFGGEDWFKLFKTYADPRNWSRTAGDYFKGSAPVPGDEHPHTGKSYDGWHGTFRECVQWGWNTSSSSVFQNILNIDFRNYRDENAARLQYSLVETEFSRVAGWREDGGLDVDDGYMLACKDKDQNVSVEVLKMVRFTDRQWPALPGGINLSQFLNFVAPSTVGLWLDSMVYESAMKALAEAASPTNSK